MRHLTLGDLFVREAVESRLISVNKVASPFNLADAGTKILCHNDSQRLWNLMAA